MARHIHLLLKWPHCVFAKMHFLLSCFQKEQTFTNLLLNSNAAHFRSFNYSLTLRNTWLNQVTLVLLIHEPSMIGSLHHSPNWTKGAEKIMCQENLIAHEGCILEWNRFKQTDINNDVVHLYATYYEVIRLGNIFF